MNKSAKWITSEEFLALLPDEKIFHKEINSYKPVYDEKLWNSHVLFRNKFNLSSTDNCKISISADDYYFLYINGKFVCSGPAPGYPWHYYYNEIDISEFTVIGENTIAVRDRHRMAADSISDKFFIIFILLNSLLRDIADSCKSRG